MRNIKLKHFYSSRGKTAVFTWIFVVILCGTMHDGFAQLGGTDRIEGKFKFLPIPFVDYNNSYGVTVGAFPIGMYNPVAKDTISPSSIGGFGATYSENGTWYVLGFGMNYLKEDTWRTTYAFGWANDRFQYYAPSPVNKYIPYQTAARFGYLDVQKRVWSDLFVGVNYLYTQFHTTSVEGERKNELNGIGMEAIWDRRSNVTYPLGGYQSSVYFLTYPSAFNTITSNQIILEHNHYFLMPNERDVLAGRFYGGFAVGSVDFNQQFVVGETDIRGYAKGKYRGNHMLAAQMEYRWNPFKRVGGVAFAGVATVFESLNPDYNGLLLPGAGVGFRYTYEKDTHSNVGFDVAVGKDDWSFNITLSEAF